MYCNNKILQYIIKNNKMYIYVCNSKIYMYIYCLKCKYYKFYAYYITLETAKDMVNYNKSQFMYLYSIV